MHLLQRVLPRLVFYHSPISLDKEGMRGKTPHLDSRIHGLEWRVSKAWFKFSGWPTGLGAPEFLF